VTTHFTKTSVNDVADERPHEWDSQPLQHRPL